MYQDKFLIISHHVTSNVMCRVVSGKISAAGSQAAFATTRSRLCTRPSLSLSLPIPTAATSGPNASPPPTCFLVWVRCYRPFLFFGGDQSTQLDLFFLILTPRVFWINHDGRGGGKRGWLPPWQNTSLQMAKAPKTEAHGYPQYFFEFGSGPLAPFLSFGTHCTLLHPLFWILGPGALIMGGLGLNYYYCHHHHHHHHHHRILI